MWLKAKKIDCGCDFLIKPKCSETFGVWWRHYDGLYKERLWQDVAKKKFGFKRHMNKGRNFRENINIYEKCEHCVRIEEKNWVDPKGKLWKIRGSLSLFDFHWITDEGTKEVQGHRKANNLKVIDRLCRWSLE